MTQEKRENQIPDLILEHLLQKQENQLTMEQEKELDEWIKNNPDINYGELVEMLKNMKLINQLELFDTKKASQKFNALQSTQKVRVYPQLIKWAAVALILISITWLAWDSIHDDPKPAEKQLTVTNPQVLKKAILKLGNGKSISLNSEETKNIAHGEVVIENKPGEKLTYHSSNDINQIVENHTLMVPRGSRYELVLSDGTKVWMNAESELVYPSSFNSNERRVKLHGEAFFDVTINPNQPFIVESANNEIRVLGTSFNISAYKNDQSFQTTLVTGKVQLDIENGESIELNPGQMAEINQATGKIDLKEVDTRIYTSWRDDILYFRDIELSALVKKLERWYGVDIQITNLEKEGIRFTGAMENQKDLDFVLNLIARTTHITIEKQNDKILIY